MMHTSTSQLGLVSIGLIKQGLVLRQQLVEEVTPGTSTKLQKEKKESKVSADSTGAPTRNSGTRRAKSKSFKIRIQQNFAPPGSRGLMGEKDFANKQKISMK